MSTAAWADYCLMGRPDERTYREQWTAVRVLERPRVMECLRIISDLGALPPNWDGYGSPGIARRAVSVAAQIVFEAPLEYLSTPHVCPVSGGAVGLHWTAGRKELELTILPNGAVEYLAVPGQQTDGEPPAEEGVLNPGREGDVRRWMQWLIEA